MRNFINLFENLDSDSEDEAVFEREKHVEKLIRYAFDRVGLLISDRSNSVIYFEENEREAEVRLDESDFDLDDLLKLKNTGLSDKFQISAHDFEIWVKFKVDPILDSAKIA